MKYTGTMTRMQRDEIPNATTRCAVPKDCVYRANGLCDEPQTNKGNSDAACHLIGNRALYEMLTPNAALTRGAEEVKNDDGLNPSS